MFPEMPRATGASPYTPLEELTENEEAAAEAVAEAISALESLEITEITVGGQHHQASPAPSSAPGERMREMFEAAALAGYQMGDPRVVGFHSEQEGAGRVENQEPSTSAEVPQMQVEARPGRGGTAAPEEDIHTLLGRIRKSAYDLGHAWFGHKKKREEFVHCFRQLQPRLAEIGTRDQQLEALIGLHRNLLDDLHACRNDSARCALENGALDVAQMAALLLRGDPLSLSVPVFQLAPVQCMHLLVESYYTLDGDHSVVSQEMCSKLLDMFSQHARQLHAKLVIVIPNLLDAVEPETRNGMRANTERRVNEGLQEMRAMLANNQPLIPCQQCLKDLPRMNHVAYQRGVCIYENQIGEFADLPEDTAMFTRMNRLIRYLARMSDACRMTVMAFLCQTVCNEMSDCLQMAVQSHFGMGFGIISLSQRRSLVEMHRTRGDGMRMRFTMEAVPMLMPIGPLGTSPIHYNDGSELMAEMEVHIEPDGSYTILPATLSLMLRGVRRNQPQE